MALSRHEIALNVLSKKIDKIAKHIEKMASKESAMIPEKSEILSNIVETKDTLTKDRSNGYNTVTVPKDLWYHLVQLSFDSSTFLRSVQRIYGRPPEHLWPEWIAVQKTLNSIEECLSSEQ